MYYYFLTKTILEEAHSKYQRITEINQKHFDQK